MILLPKMKKSIRRMVRRVSVGMSRVFETGNKEYTMISSTSGR